jgi:hypothetical protein
VEPFIKVVLAIVMLVMAQFAFIGYGDLEWWRRLYGALSFFVAWEILRGFLIEGISELAAKRQERG